MRKPHLPQTRQYGVIDSAVHSVLAHRSQATAQRRPFTTNQICADVEGEIHREAKAGERARVSYLLHRLHEEGLLAAVRKPGQNTWYRYSFTQRGAEFYNGQQPHTSHTTSQVFDAPPTRIAAETVARSALANVAEKAQHRRDRYEQMLPMINLLRAQSLLKSALRIIGQALRNANPLVESALRLIEDDDEQD